MSKPLRGQVVALTRPRKQAAAALTLLQALGAEVLEAPTVLVRPVKDLTRVDEALRHLADYDWLVFTSVNGVDAAADRMRELGLHITLLQCLKMAAIGPATADRMRQLALEPQVVPDEFVAESLAEALGQEDLAGQRFLLLRSDIARSALPDALRGMGAEVDDIPAYETAAPDALPDDATQAFREARVNWITFSSPSTFRNLQALLGADADTVLRSVRTASIGPITSQALRDAGYEPTVEAAEYTIEGLVRAIRDYAG
jgi:uroporphyrinogen III methyltransferase/synthase